ncbi:MAG TPA: pyridoxal phosphate-dependent aminotransferase [Gemmatimonadales bacterium]|nr:pyridoxal phosphate-dependent aminotransferase [Gemmatimonadales bacterium]
MHTAARLDTLGTEQAYVVLAAARRLEAQGHKVVHLEIGEPDMPTPPHVVEAGVRALREGRTRYALAAGVPELRDAIARSLAARGVRATADNVVVTPGAKPILFCAALALVGPGDEVLCPDPGFPIYDSVVRFAGGRPLYYPLDETRAFAPDVEAIRGLITPRTRALILNLPHNPTGGVATASDLAAIAELAHRHDLWVISDEVYGRVRYDGRCDSIAALPGMAERTVIVDGFSKTYSMTGWRLGYGVMPAALAEPMTTLVINNVSCTATFVQDAGIAALTGPQDAVTHMVAGLAAKRDLLVNGLNSIEGITCATPSGAFYCFPDLTGVLERTGLTCESFAERLLDERHVAVLAGTAFGPGGAGHLRLCYATGRAELERATTALRAFVGALTPAGAGLT